MTDEQIFLLAEKCGFQDDYGRWNFTSEDLLDFVFLVQKTDLRKAAEMALEALEDVFDLEKKDVAAIQALRQALAEKNT